MIYEVAGVLTPHYLWRLQCAPIISGHAERNRSTISCKGGKGTMQEFFLVSYRICNKDEADRKGQIASLCELEHRTSLLLFPFMYLGLQDHTWTYLSKIIYDIHGGRNGQEEEFTHVPTQA